MCGTSADPNKTTSRLDLKRIALHSGRKAGAPATLVGWGGRFCRRCCLSAAHSHGIKGRVQFSPFAEQCLWEQVEHILFFLDGYGIAIKWSIQAKNIPVIFLCLTLRLKNLSKNHALSS